MRNDVKKAKVPPPSLANDLPANVKMKTRAREVKDQDLNDPEILQKFSKSSLLPKVGAALVIQRYGKTYGRNLNLVALINGVGDKMDALENGSITHIEEMLLGQACALQAIFTDLAVQASGQKQMHNFEIMLRIALKAQAQCRATLQTLAEIKNPPVLFARQANFATNQQINNGQAPLAPASNKNISKQNKLLEAEHGERVDAGTAGTAIGVNSHLAPVGKKHGPTKSRGKSTSR